MMTQKEITTAKKKAKEVLKAFNIKVPMTKMCVLFFCHIYKDGCFKKIHFSFVDVRTHDCYICDCDNNNYKLTINVKETGKTHIFTACKGGKTND